MSKGTLGQRSELSVNGFEFLVSSSRINLRDLWMTVEISSSGLSIDDADYAD